MSRVVFEELKRISAEMKTIGNRSKPGARKTNRKEQERLNTLTADRDVLLGEFVFHGYGS